MVTGAGLGEQASSRVVGVMKAWIRVSAAEKESDGQRQPIFLRWKKAVFCQKGSVGINYVTTPSDGLSGQYCAAGSRTVY